MDITPERRQVIHLDPDEEGERVEFSLTPLKPGQQEIIVEFYHERHWLAQLQFTLSVLSLPVLLASE